MTFHVNPDTGDVRNCTAKISCRFGGENIHFDTEQDARKAYEIKNARENWSSLSKKNDWLSRDWETRIALLEEQTQVLAKKYKIIPPPPKVDILWEEYPSKGDNYAASYDSEKRFNREKYIKYSLRLEELEELTCKEVMCHELGHLLEWQPRVEDKEINHDARWKSNAKIIAQSVEGLENLDFPPSTALSAAESVKLEARLTRILPKPKLTSTCEAEKHVLYSSDRAEAQESCAVCFDYDGNFSALSPWIVFKETSKDQRIKNEFAKQNYKIFGKEKI